MSSGTVPVNWLSVVGWLVVWSVCIEGWGGAEERIGEYQ